MIEILMKLSTNCFSTLTFSKSWLGFNWFWTNRYEYTMFSNLNRIFSGDNAGISALQEALERTHELHVEVRVDAAQFVHHQVARHVREFDGRARHRKCFVKRICTRETIALQVLQSRVAPKVVIERYVALWWWWWWWWWWWCGCCCWYCCCWYCCCWYIWRRECVYAVRSVHIAYGVQPKEGPKQHYILCWKAFIFVHLVKSARNQTLAPSLAVSLFWWRLSPVISFRTIRFRVIVSL